MTEVKPVGAIPQDLYKKVAKDFKKHFERVHSRVLLDGTIKLMESVSYSTTPSTRHEGYNDYKITGSRCGLIEEGTIYIRGGIPVIESTP